MADKLPQFEGQDVLGTTAHFNSTVGTTAVAVPSSPGNAISEVLVSCPQQTPNTKKLLVSFDGGTLFKTLEIGEGLVWSLKGSPTQIHVKGNEANVSYEIIMNREPS